MRSTAYPRSATWVSVMGGREKKREKEAGLVCDEDSGASCTGRGMKEGDKGYGVMQTRSADAACGFGVRVGRCVASVCTP